MLPRIAPINPTRIAAPFDHQDWFFELKHDGFRALAYIEDGSCRLISRKQIQYKSFTTLCAAMAAVPVKDAILDGEFCARDLEGVVAKHRLGPYEPRPVTWFKVLNPDYSQKRGRREMFDKFRERHMEA